MATRIIKYRGFGIATHDDGRTWQIPGLGYSRIGDFQTAKDCVNEYYYKRDNEIA